MNVYSAIITYRYARVCVCVCVHYLLRVYNSCASVCAKIMSG